MYDFCAASHAQFDNQATLHLHSKIIAAYTDRRGGVDKRREENSTAACPRRLTTPRPDSILMPLLRPKQANLFVLSMSTLTCSHVASQN